MRVFKQLTQSDRVHISERQVVSRETQLLYWEMRHLEFPTKEMKRRLKELGKRLQERINWTGGDIFIAISTASENASHASGAYTQTADDGSRFCPDTARGSFQSLITPSG